MYRFRRLSCKSLHVRELLTLDTTLVEMLFRHAADRSNAILPRKSTHCCTEKACLLGVWDRRSPGPEAYPPQPVPGWPRCPPASCLWHLKHGLIQHAGLGFLSPGRGTRDCSPCPRTSAPPTVVEGQGWALSLSRFSFSLSHTDSSPVSRDADRSSFAMPVRMLAHRQMFVESTTNYGIYNGLAQSSGLCPKLLD